MSIVTPKTYTIAHVFKNIRLFVCALNTLSFVSLGGCRSSRWSLSSANRQFQLPCVIFPGCTESL
jgi:hypothetical protein